MTLLGATCMIGLKVTFKYASVLNLKVQKNMIFNSGKMRDHTFSLLRRAESTHYIPL